MANSALLEEYYILKLYRKSVTNEGLVKLLLPLGHAGKSPSNAPWIGCIVTVVACIGRALTRMGVFGVAIILPALDESRQARTFFKVAYCKKNMLVFLTRKE